MGIEDSQYRPLENLEEDESRVSKEITSLRQIRIKLHRTLIAVIVLVVLLIFALLYAASEHLPRGQKAHMVASDVLFPEFPHLPVKFEHITLFSGPPSDESDAAWADLLPKGRGWVLVEDPGQYDLPPGRDSDRRDNKGEYVVSMYHQLHCLDLVRHGYYAAVSKEPQSDAQWKSLHAHLAHCFDYLRQIVLCAGDTTLEWPRVEKNGSRIGSDGWGVTHECVDHRAIYEWTLEHRAQNSTGIL